MILNFQITFALLSFVHAGSKYYDGENRPYEFGFNIDGNQHRHEQKGDFLIST